ncbi:MAG: sterol carrier protein domain-containing protein [Candidatus Sericytochromatia bacterium]|nr:sterol carrier protein domain-containing protein [Candidatus Sericytochromatia bacterium]
MADLVRRPFQAEDTPAVCRQLLSDSLVAGKPWPLGRTNGTTGYVWEQDGEIVGSRLYLAEPIWLGGGEVTALHLTDAAFRIGALAVAMSAPPQADADAIVATQAAIATRLSTRLPIDTGFSPLPIGTEYSLPPGNHWPGRPGGIRLATPADRPVIEALQARRAMGLAGGRVRRPADWHGRIWPSVAAVDDITLLIHEGRDGPDGYVMATVTPGEVPRVSVNEWVELSGEARRKLLHALMILGGPGASLDIHPMPPDAPWPQLFDGLPATARVIRPWEWRAGAMVPFLAGMRYGPGSGSLRLAVRDPLAVWPACIELAWAEGRFLGAAPTLGPPDVTLAIDKLMLIAVGEMPVAQADYLGWLEGSTEAKSRLAQIWKKQHIYRYWADLRLYYVLRRSPGQG